MPVTRYLEADVTGTSIEVSKVLVEGVDTIGTTQGCLGQTLPAVVHCLQYEGYHSPSFML